MVRLFVFISAIILLSTSTTRASTINVNLNDLTPIGGLHGCAIPRALAGTYKDASNAEVP